MERRTAMVTGGNRGLGWGTAVWLKAQGHRVLLTARTLAKAEEAATRLGGDTIPLELDIDSVTSIDAFFAEVDRRELPVELLVNNAGAIYERHQATSLEVPPHQVLRAFTTNALGAYAILQHVIPAMNARGFGRVVNVSSGMGALTDMGTAAPAYRISKTALNAVTRVFHGVAVGDVKVNAVCPGWVRTDLGGPQATRALEEGVASIVWGLTLPSDGPSGGFFRDGEPIAW